MPVATTKSPKQKPTPRRGPAQAAAMAVPPRQIPLPDPRESAPDQHDPSRPAQHNGIPIAREELLFNIPGAYFRISRLHLADGTTAMACRDCLFTSDTRTEVCEHRNAEHGSRYGKKPPKLTFEADKQPPELVLPPRDDDEPAPSNPMEMTLAEFLSLVPSIGALGDLIDRTERQRDHYRAELEQRVRDERANKHKVDVYESLQDEVVDLRLKIRNTGSYDELKAEVLELRAWRKKMIARLGALGFNFTEEE